MEIGENVPAQEIAKDYLRLPETARLRDVVLVIRADEAHHRDVNHFAPVSLDALFPEVLFLVFFLKMISEI